MKALDLGSGRVFSTVCKLVFPAMIAQFINVLYSIVDRIYVGNIQGIGDTALAAVGVCAPVTTLISSFAFLIGTGGAPLFAMALGEKRRGRAQKILINALISLLVLSVAVTAIVFALERPLLYTFGASDRTYPYAREYLLIYASGSLFSITAVGLSQYVIAQGYSATGMATTLVGAAANIALDPLFIFVLRMDVAGAALATVISQVLSCAFVVIFLLRKSTLPHALHAVWQNETHDGRAVSKGIASDVRQPCGQGDLFERRAAVEGGRADLRHPRRQGNVCQGAAIGKGIARNERRIFGQRDAYEGDTAVEGRRERKTRSARSFSRRICNRSNRFPLRRSPYLSRAFRHFYPRAAGFLSFPARLSKDVAVKIQIF